MITASGDLVVEIGHNLIHAEDFITGTMGMHSHQVGDKVILHHKHEVLQKVEDAIDDVIRPNTDQQSRTIKTIKFDQLKTICQKFSSSNSGNEKSTSIYYHPIKRDQIIDRLPTPPPQIDFT